MTESNFYEIRQNNSGGSFDKNMPRCMWIEASSEEEACEIAEEHGVYFDGIEKGIDCHCCGDRWSRPWRSVNLAHIDEVLVYHNDPDTPKWDKWLHPLAEFKIIEKKD